MPFHAGDRGSNPRGDANDDIKGLDLGYLIPFFMTLSDHSVTASPPLAVSGFGLMDRSAIPVWNRTIVGHENDRSNNSAMAFLPFSWRNLVPVPAKCGWLMTGSFPLSRSTQSD